jgi:Uma2 family endonuclease
VGIPLYLIVDPDERAVEVWTPEATLPVLERERLAWHPEGAPEPFTLALEELFRPI